MNKFYNNVSKEHIQKLVDERDYYLNEAKHSQSEVNITGMKLMASFYSSLIMTAKLHRKENKRNHPIKWSVG